MLKVMFLCTGNSCRSQMAEGLARHFGKGVIQPYSAGVIPVGVHPMAIKVMQEIGIDISHQSSDPIRAELLNQMDVVITLCPNAEAACPKPGSRALHLHWPVKDPVGTVGPEDVVLEAFRRTRDELKERILRFIEEIKTSGLRG